jgi:hypothetical protein
MPHVAPVTGAVPRGLRVQPETDEVPTKVPVTLQGRLDTRDNALNFVRLILAGLVVVSHTWPSGGLGPDPHFGDLNLGSWAVAGFFAISGYLVTGSRSSGHRVPLASLKHGGRRSLMTVLALMLSHPRTAAGRGPRLRAILTSGLWAAGRCSSCPFRRPCLQPTAAGLAAPVLLTRALVAQPVHC